MKWVEQSASDDHEAAKNFNSSAKVIKPREYTSQVFNADETVEVEEDVQSKPVTTALGFKASDLRWRIRQQIRKIKSYRNKTCWDKKF